MADRPAARDVLDPAAGTLQVFSTLAFGALRAGKPEEALEWVRRGRAAEATPPRGPLAAMWDMLAIRVTARTDNLMEWVPELANVLDRYRDDAEASSIVMGQLLEMRLVRLVRAPDSGEEYLDTRMLESLVARHGPRVTTASGQLGVSATRPEIWTPASTAGGGNIILPNAAPSGGPSKLILPGN
jgi:hypothetical protein